MSAPTPFSKFFQALLWCAATAAFVAYVAEHHSHSTAWIIFAWVMVFVALDEIHDWLKEIDAWRAWKVRGGDER